MFWSVCSVKGGVGTSLVSASLALELMATSARVVLIDMCGDQANLLGVDVPQQLGVVDWLTAETELVDGALEHLLVDVAPGLQLLPCGSTPLREAAAVNPRRCVQLVESFAKSDHLANTAVVVDLGVLPRDVMSPHALIAVAGDRTTAVLRACYLTLRRASTLPIDVDSIVEIVEPGRSLTTLDIELVTQQPVTARLRLDPLIARAVDAGTLTSRRPRSLRRSMRDLIASRRSGGRGELGVAV